MNTINIWKEFVSVTKKGKNINYRGMSITMSNSIDR